MEDVLTISTAMSDEHDKNITDIIKSMSKRLLGFIKKRVASPEDAEDIYKMYCTSLQETRNHSSKPVVGYLK
ncbi:hypothetical protein [Ferruginibacter sp.]|uniref:hypothetical protein n=1 Tax=Ferruginibacter sp. TaxID=1940288 RepID=UPI00265957A7|nr:hypothetical protein [Ferruginibacter sp.]